MSGRTDKRRLHSVDVALTLPPGARLLPDGTLADESAFVEDEVPQEGPVISLEPVAGGGVNLSDSDAARVRGLALRHGWTEKEALRRAIATTAFIDNQIAHGFRILLRDPSGNMLELSPV